MSERVLLSGKYVVVNEAFMQEKANRDDPRNVFYRALLASASYEEYLAKVGSTLVEPRTHTSGSVSGRREILYIRYEGWIEDAA